MPHREAIVLEGTGGITMHGNGILMMPGNGQFKKYARKWVLKINHNPNRPGSSGHERRNTKCHTFNQNGEIFTTKKSEKVETLCLCMAGAAIALSGHHRSLLLARIIEL
jgi:hypothetical protein